MEAEYFFLLLVGTAGWIIKVNEKDRELRIWK